MTLPLLAFALQRILYAALFIDFYLQPHSKAGHPLKCHTKCVLGTAAIRAAVACFAIDNYQGGELMPSKDVTRNLGSVGMILSILILLTAAGAAYGQYAVYRTNTYIQPGSQMAPVVITYGGPTRSSTVYRTRPVKYVAVRENTYYNDNGRKYIAVRNDNGQYAVSQTRYIAFRNVDLDNTRQYVAVRRQAANVYTNANYVVVSNNVPQTRYVAVRDIDTQVATPHYIAVHNSAPSTQYVAVRNDFNDVGTPDYVAVSNVDTDDVAVPNPHVVVKDDYIAGTEQVVYSGDANLAVNTITPIEKIGSANAVYTNAAYTETPAPVTYAAIPALREAPVMNDVTFVPADDVTDANDPNVSLVPADDMNAQATEYVPVTDMDAQTVRYVPVSNMNVEPVSFVPIDETPTPVTTVVAEPIAANEVTY
jgi:hypothetical protein